MYSTVLVKRPQASSGRAKAVFCQVPSITRGCSACRYMARTPAIHITGSLDTRQVTEPGPNRP